MSEVGALGQVSSRKVHSTHGMWYQITLQWNEHSHWLQQNDLPNSSQETIKHGLESLGIHKHSFSRMFAIFEIGFWDTQEIFQKANCHQLFPTGWPRTRGLHASRRPRYRTRSSLLAWHRWVPVWCRMVWICFTLPKTNIFAPENRPYHKETHLPTIHFHVRTCFFQGRVIMPRPWTPSLPGQRVPVVLPEAYNASTAWVVTYLPIHGKIDNSTWLRSHFRHLRFFIFSKFWWSFLQVDDEKKDENCCPLYGLIDVSSEHVKKNSSRMLQDSCVQKYYDRLRTLTLLRRKSNKHSRWKYPQLTM